MRTTNETAFKRLVRELMQYEVTIRPNERLEPHKKSPNYQELINYYTYYQSEDQKEIPNWVNDKANSFYHKLNLIRNLSTIIYSLDPGADQYALGWLYANFNQDRFLNIKDEQHYLLVTSLLHFLKATNIEKLENFKLSEYVTELEKAIKSSEHNSNSSVFSKDDVNLDEILRFEEERFKTRYKNLLQERSLYKSRFKYEITGIIVSVIGLILSSKLLEIFYMQLVSSNLLILLIAPPVIFGVLGFFSIGFLLVDLVSFFDTFNICKRIQENNFDTIVNALKEEFPSESNNRFFTSGSQLTAEIDNPEKASNFVEMASVNMKQSNL